MYLLLREDSSSQPHAHNAADSTCPAPPRRSCSRHQWRWQWPVMIVAVQYRSDVAGPSRGTPVRVVDPRRRGSRADLAGTGNAIRGSNRFAPAEPSRCPMERGFGMPMAQPRQPPSWLQTAHRLTNGGRAVRRKSSRVRRPGKRRWRLSIPRLSDRCSPPRECPARSRRTPAALPGPRPERWK